MGCSAVPPDSRRRAGALRRAVASLDVPRSLTPPIWLELMPPWPARTPQSSNGRPQAAVTHDVLLVPGFLATDQTTAALARSLRAAGHRTHHARLGTTNGCSEVLATRLVGRLDELAGAHHHPITLIGHSRGGMIAKVAAQRRPDLVRGLFTLGTPLTDPWGMHLALKLLIVGISRAGRAGLATGTCGDRDCPFGACSTDFFDDLASDLPADVGFTSIYSRRDGITQWRCCLHPGARHLEVDCSHFAMTVDPTVPRTSIASSRGRPRRRTGHDDRDISIDTAAASAGRPTALPNLEPLHRAGGAQPRGADRRPRHRRRGDDRPAQRTPRRVPLLAWRHGRTITVSTVRPDSDWVRNLEHRPVADVWIGGHPQTSARRS